MRPVLGLVTSEFGRDQIARWKIGLCRTACRRYIAEKVNWSERDICVSLVTPSLSLLNVARRRKAAQGMSMGVFSSWQCTVGTTLQRREGNLSTVVQLLLMALASFCPSKQGCSVLQQWKS